jgi:hypothetical protein
VSNDVASPSLSPRTGKQIKIRGSPYEIINGLITLGTSRRPLFGPNNVMATKLITKQNCCSFWRSSGGFRNPQFCGREEIERHFALMRLKGSPSSICDINLDGSGDDSSSDDDD